MRKIYSHFRIFLLMFALGLAFVRFFNEFGAETDKIPINLPQIVSESPIYVSPTRNFKISTRTHCTGHACSVVEFFEFDEEIK